MPNPTRDENLREEFNRWAEAGRGEEMEERHLPITLPVLDLMQLAPDDNVLDLGCGAGWLARLLAERVPEGPWHYPEDQLTDAPLRQFAAEITREKLYLRLHQELPYRSTVETDVWKQLKDGAVRIEQTIFVERESQRKILLGKEGRTIKAIGAEARREIAEAIEAPVHLFLFVKVREHWGEDPERYREMGLAFPER